MSAPIPPNKADELLQLAIDEGALTPEMQDRLRAVPPTALLALGRWLKPSGIYPTLAARAPSRGGVDAWTWVENGHSWSEVTGQYSRFFEGEISQ